VNALNLRKASSTKREKVRDAFDVHVLRHVCDARVNSRLRHTKRAQRRCMTAEIRRSQGGHTGRFRSEDARCAKNLRHGTAKRKKDFPVLSDENSGHGIY
jgi:predicted alpha-1,6-mannanase (GH76 family)